MKSPKKVTDGGVISTLTKTNMMSRDRQVKDNDGVSPHLRPSSQRNGLHRGLLGTRSPPEGFYTAPRQILGAITPPPPWVKSIKTQREGGSEQGVCSVGGRGKDDQ